MSIALADIIGLAHQGHLEISAEISAFIALEVATAVRPRPQTVSARDITLLQDGTVCLAPQPSLSPEQAARGLQTLLSDLLATTRLVRTSLARVASREAQDPATVVERLEAALIPLNRPASRRALVRLAREAATRLPLLIHAQPRLPAASELPSVGIPPACDRVEPVPLPLREPPPRHRGPVPHQGIARARPEPTRAIPASPPPRLEPTPPLPAAPVWREHTDKLPVFRTEKAPQARERSATPAMPQATEKVRLPKVERPAEQPLTEPEPPLVVPPVGWDYDPSEARLCTERITPVPQPVAPPPFPMKPHLQVAVACHRSSVEKLVDAFQVTEPEENQDVSRDLRRMAGISVTPPPVQAEPIEEPRKTGRHTGAGALALLLLVGFGWTEARPRHSAAQPQRLQLQTPVRSCSGVVIVSDLPASAEVAGRSAREVFSPSSLSDDSVHFSGLPCGKPLDITLELTGPGGERVWRRLPVAAEQMAAPEPFRVSAR